MGKYLSNSMILPVVSVVFFFSGLAGLVYQVVWTRMLLVNFGSTTHTITAVVSAFMAGLAIGSYIAPAIYRRFPKLLLVYAVLEFIIGISALTTPLLFSGATVFYSAFYYVIPNASLLLALKFFLITLALLPSTIAMGATLPVLVQFVTQKLDRSVGKTVSILYGVNTLGAFVGVLLTAYVFIELFGLRLSLGIAAAINLCLALVIFVIHKGKRIDISYSVSKREDESEKKSAYTKRHVTIVLGFFSISGLISMSYEILWTRMLTPVAGTYIYAFAPILALFLLGIVVGSILMRFIRWPLLIAPFGF